MNLENPPPNHQRHLRLRFPPENVAPSDVRGFLQPEIDQAFGRSNWFFQSVGFFFGHEPPPGHRVGHLENSTVA